MNELSTDDLLRLRASVEDALRLRRPSICVLNSDVLRIILSFLNNVDQWSLIVALVDVPRYPWLICDRARTYNLERRILMAALIDSIKSSVLDLFDRALYEIRYEPFTVVEVFAHWSPFSDERADCIARFYWCAWAPHARLQCNHEAMARAAGRALVRGQSDVLLVAHRSYESTFGLRGFPFEMDFHHVPNSSRMLSVRPFVHALSDARNKFPWLASLFGTTHFLSAPKKSYPYHAKDFCR